MLFYVCRLIYNKFYSQVIETNRLGRVIAYDPVSGNSWLIKDKLYLANGLTLSPDETYLLVAEMSVSRISK